MAGLSPQVGVPAEIPGPAERGLLVTDFVDRSADPVGIMAADGSFHRGETLIAGALRALTYAVTGGWAPVSPPGVTFPAHWSPAAVAALRRELVRLPEWSAHPERLTLTSDAAAALTSLQAEPGLPTRGVIALCDFGGTGTSITLADAAAGYRPIGTTIRHADLSGELIDRALLAHAIADLSVAGTADLAGTAAIGSLHRLRDECRCATERLSRSAVTTLFADVPGYTFEVRLTRAELDGEIRAPLSVFVDVLREHLSRNRIHPADMAGTMTTVRPEPASPAAAAPSELAVTPEDAAGAPSYIQAPAPLTRVVVTTPPPVVMWAPAPAVAPPPADIPPPPTTTSPPPSSPPSGPPSSEPPSSPPSSEPPSSEPPSPDPPTQEDPPTQGEQPK